MLKPMDIHNKEFKKSVRGYDAEEVDEFLDEIIIDFEKMQRELDLLRNQLNSYSENMTSYRDKEAALNNALVSAQQFADQMKKDAEQKASIILLDAEQKAKELIGNTEKKYNAMQADYSALTTRYQDAKATLKDYFEQQIQQLDKHEPAFIGTEKLSLSLELTKEEEHKPEEQILIRMEETAALEADAEPAAAMPSRSDRKNGTNITATYFAQSVNNMGKSTQIPPILSNLESATDNDQDETKVNLKLKEMMDARLYEEGNTEVRF